MRIAEPISDDPNGKYDDCMCCFCMYGKYDPFEYKNQLYCKRCGEHLDKQSSRRLME